jgi:hypothetical protein
MSDVVDIKELQQQAVEKSNQEFAVQQQKLIEKLLIENKRQQERVAHLEQLIKSLQSTEGVVQRLTPEELICIEQINILHNRSSQRELTLEEVKRLDLLVKNLRLIRELSTQVLDYTGPREVTEEDLVAIARAETD